MTALSHVAIFDTDLFPVLTMPHLRVPVAVMGILA